MAIRAGQAIGGLTVVLGLVLGLFVNVIDGVWVALIGGFLFSVATASYRGERSRVHVLGVEKASAGYDP